MNGAILTNSAIMSHTAAHGRSQHANGDDNDHDDNDDDDMFADADEDEDVHVNAPIKTATATAAAAATAAADAAFPALSERSVAPAAVWPRIKRKTERERGRGERERERGVSTCLISWWGLSAAVWLLCGCVAV